MYNAVFSAGDVRGAFDVLGVVLSELPSKYKCTAANTVVSVADSVRNVSWTLFQEGRSSKLRLRRGVEQSAHTLSIIPKLGVLEFYCA